MHERQRLLWYMEHGVPQSILKTWMEPHGSLEAALTHGDFSILGKHAAVVRKEPTIKEARRLEESLAARGIQVWMRGEETYPKPLEAIEDAPLLLYAMGDWEPIDTLSVGVVGSRKCTSYGAWACESIVRGLAEYRVTIISGMALGIDKIAHETALAHGTRTIGVLGNGLNTVYPKRHADLYRRVAQQGLLLTEFPTWAEPLPFHFPYRNRIIAGLSLGLLVVEATEKSGTMSTASHALAQGKDVYAVPGNLNSLYSTGCNRLIKDGAALVLSADSILEEIAAKQPLPSKPSRTPSNLSEEEERIADVLRVQPHTLDELVEALDASVESITQTLTLLELRGAVRVDDALCQWME